MQLEHPLFGQHDEVISGKHKVGNAALDDDFPNQVAIGRPDVEPVTATTVDVAVQVSANSVGNPCTYADAASLTSNAPAVARP